MCVVKNNFLLCLQTTDLSVFETNIRFIGGLLTCFALTGDVMFRDKAEQVAKKLLPAFQTQTGLPHSLINIKTGVKNVLHVVYQGTLYVVYFSSF
jgi:mannosyl-oligosaccharide alpha-1,2-mannosidase